MDALLNPPAVEAGAPAPSPQPFRGVSLRLDALTMEQLRRAARRHGAANKIRVTKARSILIRLAITSYLEAHYPAPASRKPARRGKSKHRPAKGD